MAEGGQAVVGRPFSERLAMLQDLDSNRFSGVRSQLVMKSFFRKEDIGKLLAHIVIDEDGDRVFTDSHMRSSSSGRSSSSSSSGGGSRHHKSDGLIFQPGDRRYTFAADDALLKWKWPDMASVDLRVELDPHTGEVQSLNAFGPGTTEDPHN